ncbi:MAG: Nramp family divalent metal transporter [Rubrobacteraceae bacterium]
MILWPYITMQVGIGVLWLAVFGVGVQFFLNMEIERYTRHRRGSVTGFTRFWKPWGIFCLGAIPPNLLGIRPSFLNEISPLGHGKASAGQIQNLLVVDAKRRFQ